MYDPPAYLSVVTLIGTIGVPALTCVVLYRGAIGADLGRRTAALLAGTAALVLGGWLAASIVLARAGAYHAQLGQQPPWLVIGFAGSLVVLVAATRLPVVTRSLSTVGTPARFLLPHTFRVAGLAFLLAMALGQLPALFALPAGLGDIAVGISAPFVARKLAGGDGRRRAVWFNALGIVDLVVAMSLGALTGFDLIHVTPAADAIGEFPLALIPTATVPLLLTLHITSLRQLGRVRSLTPAARIATA